MALIGLGCDRGSPLLDTLEMGPEVKVLLTIPEVEAIDVPVDQSIRVQFDRFLSPLSVTRQSICIASIGPTTAASGRTGCEQFPKPEYDPVDRVAVWKPSRPLQPGVRYAVVIRPPEDEEDLDGIRAFDGAPLEAPYIFAFTTERRGPCTKDEDCKGRATCEFEGETSAKKTCRMPSNEPERHVDFCSESPWLCTLPPDACHSPGRMRATTPGPRELLRGCGNGPAHCHGGGDEGSGKAGALSLANGGIRDYIGKVASQTATSANPMAANRLGIPFGVNMPYVDPGFPENSYLLWKLVLGLEGRDVALETPVYPSDGYRCEDLPEMPTLSAGADGICDDEPGSPPSISPLVRTGEEQPGSVEPWIPPALSQPIAKGEYERLGRSLRGLGMPFGPNARSYPASVRAISAWIADGAPVPECP